jgi:SAM-dependent methyltransferase
MRIEDQIDKEFSLIPLRPKTMLFYTVRTAILKSVILETASFYGTVLDIGCGLMPYKKLIQSNPRVEKYIGMDWEQSAYHKDIKPDLQWDGEKIPLPNESVDCAMATEFLEHSAAPDKILEEIFRVIKPNGRFFATVPFVWNLHEIPYDEYRYTPFSLERHLKNSGFKNMNIKALGGWNLSLAQMIGLWISFSKMNGLVRRFLRILLFPAYVWLIKTDRKPIEFDGSENSMFTGLSITACK